MPGATLTLNRLQQRVHVPYEALQLLVARLKKLQEAADILRRTSRFVILARRLQLQMSEMKSGTPTESGDNLGGAGIEDDKERAVAKAALTISEVSSVLDGPSSDSSGGISLRSITAVAAFETFVEDSRAQVNAEMEHMVISGLKGLVSSQPVLQPWVILTSNRIKRSSHLHSKLHTISVSSLNSSRTSCATSHKRWKIA